jgi:LysR family transcriptional regulator, transcriptional activator for aaeXAB operon
MERVSHELSVLARAVAYKNLSGASLHVGVSQPQLSRIIKRIEETFSVVLLDRSAKRNATWTPTAYRLADFYAKKMRIFERELDAVIGASHARQLQVGTLEGLMDIATPYSHFLLEKAGVRLVEMDVLDLDRLEELFTRGELDLIFTSREPGKKKHQNVKTLGFQSLDSVTTNNQFQVMSTFEYGTKRDRLKGAEKVLISNSLSLRRHWFQNFGGVGTLPSEPKKQKHSSRDTEPVLMIASDVVSPILWKQLLAFDS